MAADLFAVNVLLDPADYDCFLSRHTFSYVSIKAFAESQGVPPYVVIGRLQKEERIPWTWYQKYKPRYKPEFLSKAD